MIKESKKWASGMDAGSYDPEIDLPSFEPTKIPLTEKDIKNMKPQVQVQAKQEANNRFQQDLKKRIDENKAFNKNILEHKAELDKVEFITGDIIVRMLKFEGEQDNEGMLLERKFKPFETEGGRPASKIDDWDYSTKAVVVKMPSTRFLDLMTSEHRQRYDLLKEGDIVWLNMSVMQRAEQYAFIHERNYPVQGYEGYLLMPISKFDVIEGNINDSNKVA